MPAFFRSSSASAMPLVSVSPMGASGPVMELITPMRSFLLDGFAGATNVVCPSGSCTAMVRKHFAELLPGDARVADLASRTYELCEFLHDVLKVSVRGRFPHRVGLHRSCHGLRELRLGSGS